MCRCNVFFSCLHFFCCVLKLLSLSLSHIFRWFGGKICYSAIDRWKSSKWLVRSHIAEKMEDYQNGENIFELKWNQVKDIVYVNKMWCYVFRIHTHTYWNNNVVLEWREPKNTKVRLPSNYLTSANKWRDIEKWANIYTPTKIDHIRCSKPCCCILHLSLSLYSLYLARAVSK